MLKIIFSRYQIYQVCLFLAENKVFYCKVFCNEAGAILSLFPRGNVSISRDKFGLHTREEGAIGI